MLRCRLTFLLAMVAGCSISGWGQCSASQPQVTQCASVPSPSGCVTISFSTDPTQNQTCGNFQNNMRTIKYILGDAYSRSENACPNNSEIPSGWVITGYGASNSCGSAGSLYSLQNLNGAPLGATVNACNNSTTPLGWSASPPGVTPCGLGFVQNVFLETLTYNQPDFSISVSPSTESVATGNTASFQISTSGSLGLSSPITLSASGLPNGLSAGFNPPNPLPGSSSTLTISSTGQGFSGNLRPNIMGVNGNVSHAASVNLTVTPGWWPAIQQVLDSIP
jgi:hypothetical protein